MQEEWKTIPDFEDYTASNLGNIKRKITISKAGWAGKRSVGGLILSPKIKANGYLEVSLRLTPGVRKSAYVHRLVFMAFHGLIPSHLEINHIDGDKSNNSLSNLELVDKSGNIKHAYRTGLRKTRDMRGDNHPSVKLNTSIVMEIKGLFALGQKVKDIATRLNIPRGTVSGICYNLSWKHVVLNQ
jgi:hypothetical protein